MMIDRQKKSLPYLFYHEKASFSSDFPHVTPEAETMERNWPAAYSKMAG